MSTNKPLVLIADDHVVIRTGIKMMISKHVGNYTLLEADSLSGILDVLKLYPVTHMILDLELKDGNLIDIMPVLAKEYKLIPMLIYTMSPEELFGARLLQLGASGYLSKASDVHAVIQAFRLLFKGETYISDALRTTLEQKKTRFDDPLKSLSKREMSVLLRLMKGSTLKGIAEELNIQTPTVATYKARVFEKLGVINLMDLRNAVEVYKLFR